MENRDAFNLPDGSVLSYARPNDKGSQDRWFRTRFTGSLLTWTSKQKKSSIRLGLWSGRGTCFVVPADFDELPEGFKNWDRLEEYLQRQYRGKALVARSFSGKIKCFFVVCLEGGQMSAQVALDTLEVLLDCDLFDSIDKRTSALSITFLTRKMTEILLDLHHLKTIPAILDSIDLEDSTTEEDVNKNITSPHRYRTLSGSLPECMETWVKCAPLKDALARILCVSPVLVSGRGMDLPTTKLARECNTSPMAISRAIKSLIAVGLLECISEHYWPGKKAKSYKACGALKEYLLARSSYESKFPSDLSKFKIPDGKWNEEIFRLSGYYGPDYTRFRHAALKIPEVHKKDRIRKIDSAIAQRLKYQAQREKA